MEPYNYTIHNRSFVTCSSMHELEDLGLELISECPLHGYRSSRFLTKCTGRKFYRFSIKVLAKDSIGSPLKLL